MDARASEEGICCLAVVATFQFGKHEGTPITKWIYQRRFQGAQVPVDGRKQARQEQPANHGLLKCQRVHAGRGRARGDQTD